MLFREKGPLYLVIFPSPKEVSARYSSQATSGLLLLVQPVSQDWILHLSVVFLENQSNILWHVKFYEIEIFVST